MELFAIFGNPVSHSLSPRMHNHAFHALGFDGCYGRWLLTDGSRLREHFFRLRLKGANITVPHKEAAFEACDILDPFARRVEAVNTIVLRQGKLHGYNTDAPGFLKAIEPFGRGLSVLFLGAGGTAQATAEILRETGYRVTILNRSAPRLGHFKAAGFEAFTWEDFPADRSFDLIVNMTSAGLQDDALPAPETLLKGLVSRAKACIDVIYGHETPFVHLAKALGKPVRDGTQMLLYQGVLAFDHFTEYRYEHGRILQALRAGLEL